MAMTPRHSHGVRNREAERTRSASHVLPFSPFSAEVAFRGLPNRMSLYVEQFNDGVVSLVGYMAWLTVDRLYVRMQSQASEYGQS